MILEGKTVVISGVGPGLGREVATCALRDGANVVIAARTQEKLDTIAKELDATGERVLAKSADITDYESCEALMKAAVDRFGALDAVVNVAALDTIFGTLESTTDEIADELELDWMGDGTDRQTDTTTDDQDDARPRRRTTKTTHDQDDVHDVHDVPPEPQFFLPSHDRF